MCDSSMEDLWVHQSAFVQVAEVFVAQFVVRWVGLIFRRQMPVTHVLSKTTLPKAGFCIRSLKLYVQGHYPILQILAYTFSFKKDFSCE